MTVWFVIATRPAQEHKAIASFEQLKIECYRPQEIVWRKVARRRIEQPRPLIRGYVFARLAPDDIHQLHGMDGVAYLITAVQQQKLIDFIEWLQELEGQGEFDRTLAEKRRKGAVEKMEGGEPVKITGGKFSGFEATFLRMDVVGKARVMFAIFGRPSEMTVPLSQLEAA